MEWSSARTTAGSTSSARGSSRLTHMSVWRARAAAFSAAPRRSVAISRALPAGSSSSREPLRQAMGVSRLLKSCTRLAVKWPIDSTRCSARSSASWRRCSVISRTTRICPPACMRASTEKTRPPRPVSALAAPSARTWRCRRSISRAGSERPTRRATSSGGSRWAAAFDSTTTPCRSTMKMASGTCSRVSRWSSSSAPSGEVSVMGWS